MIAALDYLRRKTIPFRRWRKGRRSAFLYNFVYHPLPGSKRGRQTVLFYPQHPRPDHLLYKYFHLLGYRFTTDPRKSASIAVRFEDVTYKRDVPELDALRGRIRVLNRGCADGSKSAVQRAFASVFGYELAVDPRTHVGPCVCKSELNAVHDGHIVECPTQPRPGYVYERELDNQHGELYQDIRVSVIGDSVPFVYIKYHAPNQRFGEFVQTTMHETADVLSPDEAARCVAICRAMGVDYGELDVIRDRGDGRIYVVDVNDTPSGPSVCLTAAQRAFCARRGAEAFKAAFIDNVAAPVIDVIATS